ncbi:MAG: type II toxin-antitoxin system RelE/ParE family toxin [Sphingobacteriales bacterium]|nr:type II toxin-antitoxin system RelE/ParE family toxin [Sphingobacteriales bacterium]
MVVKWSKSSVKQFIEILSFLEAQEQFKYAERLEQEILKTIILLSSNPSIFQIDRLKQDNDGSFYAFEIDSFRISFRKLPKEIRILRIRHTSRRPYQK